MKKLAPTIGKAAPADVRRLAEDHGEKGKVLTLYLDLEASKFATLPARESQIVSLLDEAAQSIEELGGEDKKGLREDLEDLRAYLLDRVRVGAGGGGGRGVPFGYAGALRDSPGSIPGHPVREDR